MSAVLLDTHALVWSLLEPGLLSKDALACIKGSEIVYASVASIYEIDFKRAAGRLRQGDGLLSRMPANMPGVLPMLGLTLLPLDAESAWRAARLPIKHGDPWDRILVAQALVLDVPLISRDVALTAATQTHPKTAGVIVY